MTTPPDRPKKPLLARIISLEGAMAAFAVYSLASGLLAAEGEEAVTQIFWGVMILCGLCLLVVVRRRDWKKHWAELEAASTAQPGQPPPEQTETNRTER